MNMNDVPLEEKHEGKYYDPSKKEKYIKRALKMTENKKLSKECGRCHEIKPLAEFVKNKNSKDGYRIYCKDCSNEMGRMYYARRKLKTLEPPIIEPEGPELGPEPEESIYEWVKTLPESKRALLDPDKISKHIIKELFSKQGEDK